MRKQLDSIIGPALERSEGIKIELFGLDVKAFNVLDYEVFGQPADIGAGNSRFAVVGKKQGGAVEEIFRVIYPSQTIGELGPGSYYEVINEALSMATREYGIDKISTGAFACAGPIKAEPGNIGREVTFSNIQDQRISTSEIKERCSLDVVLMNDYQGILNGIPSLRTKGDVKKVVDQEQHLSLEDAAVEDLTFFIAIGAGGGLGEAIALYDRDSKEYNLVATEGGHKTWTPNNELEHRLQNWLRNKFDGKPPEEEHIVSGPGLENIFDFLNEFYNSDLESEYDYLTRRIEDNQGQQQVGVNIAQLEEYRAFIEELREAKLDEEKQKQYQEMKAAIENANDKPAEISVCAKKDNPHILIRKTWDIFFDSYAQAIRNGSLFPEAKAIFIAGGITPKNIELLEERLEPFCRILKSDVHESVEGMLREKEIYVIMNPYVGLLGAENVVFDDAKRAKYK